MPEYVRVKQVETGHELTVTTDFLSRVDGLDPLEKPAVDTAGAPIPTKHAVLRKKRTPQTPAPETGHEATTKKEGA